MCAPHYIHLCGVECGGTTFQLTLAVNSPTQVVQRCVIPTTTPWETILKVAQQLCEWNADYIGVASFGPLDLDPNSSTYGYITSTPKPGWKDINLLGLLQYSMWSLSLAKPYPRLVVVKNTTGKDQYTLKTNTIGRKQWNFTPAWRENISAPKSTPSLPTTDVNEQNAAITAFADKMISNLHPRIGFNTDCNAAAAAEMLYGEHRNIASLCYITVGTGIGVGIAMHPSTDPKDVLLVSNMLHPEAGHLLCRRHPQETLVGNCPFHGDCIEGLSNNHSTAERANCVESDLPSLPDNHITWEITAYNLAQLCANLVYTVSPHKIVIGGGLARRQFLLDAIRKHTARIINEYVVTKELGDMSSYITTSLWNSPNSSSSIGSIGALHLAAQRAPDPIPAKL